MLNFFYDSLETLKKVRVPSKKEIINFTLIILFVIIVAGIFFLIVDNIWGQVFKMIYTIVRGS